MEVVILLSFFLCKQHLLAAGFEIGFPLQVHLQTVPCYIGAFGFLQGLFRSWR